MTTPTTPRGVAAKLRADLALANEMATTDYASAYGSITAAVEYAVGWLDLLVQDDDSVTDTNTPYLQEAALVVRRWRLEHGDHPNPFVPKHAERLLCARPEPATENDWASAILWATSIELDVDEAVVFVRRLGAGARWSVLESQLGGPACLYTAAATEPGQPAARMSFRGQVDDAVATRTALAALFGAESPQ